MLWVYSDDASEHSLDDGITKMNELKERKFYSSFWGVSFT